MENNRGPIAKLIEDLRKLPGVGEKSAARLAFFILRQKKEDSISLANSIIEVKEKIILCTTCWNLTDIVPCRICRDPRRDDHVICVVESPLDIKAIEHSGYFRGKYHVLHGVISPIDGVGPDSLRIGELLERVKDGAVKEIILATNPTMEGEVTAQYISKLLKDVNKRITRIAFGLPMGGDLQYIDQVTIKKSLEYRREM